MSYRLYKVGDVNSLANENEALWQGNKIRIQRVLYEAIVRTDAQTTVASPVGIEVDSDNGTLTNGYSLEVINPIALGWQVKNNYLVVEGLIHARLILTRIIQNSDTVDVPLELNLPVAFTQPLGNNIGNMDLNSVDLSTRVLSSVVCAYPAQEINLYNLLSRVFAEVNICITRNETINTPSIFC